MTIQIPGLPTASVANDSDYMLLRSGFTDYKVAVSAVRSINIKNLSPIPNGYAINTDQLLISRVISGSPQNFNITFGQIGFQIGTQMWFYNNSPPSSAWVVVPNTGDRLLAVSSMVNTPNSPPVPNYNKNGGTQSGPITDYLIPGTALTLDQIPPHFHGVGGSYASTNGSGATNYARYAQKSNAEANINSANAGGNANGAANPHTHPATYRPAANVGIIYQKVL